MNDSGRIVCLLHDRDFEPFAFVRQGRSTGLAPDLLRAALDGAGSRPVFWATAMAAVPRLLQYGAADGVAVMGVTPERRVSYEFSRPFVRTGGALFAKAGRTTGLTPAALAGQPVCTPGSGPLATYLRRQYPGICLRLVSDYRQALEEVAAGRVAAAALNYHAGRRLVRRCFAGRLAAVGGMFHTLYLAAAVPKGRAQGWLAPVNGELQRMQASGIYDRIVRKWLW